MTFQVHDHVFCHAVHGTYILYKYYNGLYNTMHVTLLYYGLHGTLVYCTLYNVPTYNTMHVTLYHIVSWIA